MLNIMSPGYWNNINVDLGEILSFLAQEEDEPD
jgi:hypothetical protein